MPPTVRDFHITPPSKFLSQEFILYLVCQDKPQTRRLGKCLNLVHELVKLSASWRGGIHDDDGYRAGKGSVPA